MNSPCPTVSPNQTQVELFFRHLYSGAGRGYLTLAFKDERERMIAQFFDLSFTAMDQVARSAASIASSRDVYFGVGLREQKLEAGKRGDAESVIVIPGFWIDCDIADAGAHAELNYPPDEDAAMLIVRSSGMEPTVIVHSGHGLHGYFLFNRPLVVGPENRHRVKAAAAKFQAVLAAAAKAKGWRLDNTSDLARILRPAGTVNWKRPEEPKLLTFESTGPRYDLEQIEEVLRSCTTEAEKSGFVGFEGFAADSDAIGESSAPVRPASSKRETAAGAAVAVPDAPEEPVPAETTAAGRGEFPPADIGPIVNGCAWMRHCRDEAENLPEPEWYGALSILARCKDGERLAHEWSRPYPRYTAAETQKKLGHALEAAGPVTCVTVMEKLNQERFCNKCDCRGLAKSPINFGTPQADVESPAPQATEWPAPKPLSTKLLAVPQFDPELLPAEFREYAVDVAERMQVPLDFPGAALLVALAGMVGRRARITPKQYDHTFVVVPNLWGGIVARPGQLKSPLIGDVFRPVRAMEKEAIEAHAAAMMEYERELDAWEQRKKKAYGKGGSGEFDEPKPERPLGIRYLVHDATLEKLHAILVDNPQGVLLYRDELAGWFATLDTKGHERDRPFFLESWNGDSPYTIDRVQRGTLYVPHLCLSVFGGIQPARLQSYLTDAVLGGGGDDGLAQRLQVLVWPDQDTEWRNVDRAPNGLAATGVEQVFRRIAAMSEAQPLCTRFAPDAQELFDCWRSELEGRVRKGKLPPHLESHLAKYRSLMPSLALLLHIADGGHDQPAVPLVHAQRAADLCDYLEAHARRVYSCVTSFPDRAAATLGEKIQKGALGTRFTIRDVYYKCWANLTKAEQVKMALGVLQEAGWVRRIERGPGPEGGRPTEDFVVNPAVYRG